MSNPKSKRFLLESIVSTPDERTLFHRGRIKITSPEQFVPLYLANYGKDAFPNMDVDGVNCIYRPDLHGGIENRYWLYLPSVVAAKAGKLLSSTNNLKNPEKREEFKALTIPELKRILSSPLPTEYAIVSNRGAGTQNYGLNQYSFMSIFSELSIGGPMSVSSDYNVLIGLGLIMNVFATNYVSKQSTLYPANYYIQPLHLLTPEIVVVVKYKYLASARASLYLRVPMEIPYDGIKLLRRQVLHNSKAQEMYNMEISTYVQESGMQMEFVKPEEMEKYLFPPKVKKTREAYLADAKRALNEEVPHVIF
jgi:hypothetical protein